MQNYLFVSIFCFLFSLNLLAQPVAQFTADTTSGCVPLQVNFRNLSVGATNFEWSFGDGNYSTQTNPSNLYVKAGVYHVKLIAVNAAQSDTLVKNAYIQVFPKPQVDYAIFDSVQCLYNDSIQFTNFGDTAHNYTWVFGDGTVSNAYNAVHQYSSSGSFRTLLTASTIHGCTAQKSLSKRINVFSNPVANFIADTSLVCRDGQPVRFISTSSSSLLHYWDFGDGNKDSLSNQVSHIYQNQGKFDVTLKIKDSKGCETSLKNEKFIHFKKPEKPTIQLNKDTICSRQTVNFQVDSFWVGALWNFDEHSVSHALNPNYTFSDVGFHSIRVDLTDSVGCTVRHIIDSIDVKQSPIASIRDTAFNACVPFSFQASNTSFFATNYQWKIGLHESSDLNPRFTLSQAGLFDLELIATNDFCADTLIASGLINLKGGKRSTSISDSIGCAPMEVDFYAEIIDSANLTWHFGNGDTSSLLNPKYTYQFGGTYRPFLVTETPNSCIDTVFLTEIRVIDAQSVFHFPDTIVLCEPGTVSFDGSSIGGKTWSWDFGDGDTSINANPQHFFDSSGTYTVELLTQNTEGCFYRLKPYNVVVVKSSKSNFSIDIDNCPDFKVNFNSVDTGIVSWQWDFGDGTNDTIANPIHYYAEKGAYTISLSTWDKDACFSNKTLVNGLILYPCIGDSINSSGLGGPFDGKNVFSDSASSINACNPFQLDLFLPFDSVKNQWWDFGDGNSSSLPNPTHVYTNAGNYSLTLIVEYLDGSFDTIQNQDYIKLGQPKAAFGFQIENSCDSSTVTFINQSTNASTYFWNMDAAGISNQFNVSASYKEPSNQLIRLTAMDDKGCTHTVNKNIGVGISNPFFSFKANACLGETIEFKSNIDNYDRLVWHIGNLSFNGSVVNCYPVDTGLFEVSVKAYDRDNCVTTFTSPVKLRVSNPVADFSFNGNTTQCDFLELNVTNRSTGAKEFTWYFDNGDSSKLKQPNYTFKKEGTYSISLKAEQFGCSNLKQASQAIIIHKAKADFELQQNKICLPIQANFIDKSINAVSWQWSFGDGDSSFSQHPSHVYHIKPDVQKLSIVDSNGCRAKTQKNELKLHQAVALADVWEGCVPLTVQFNDTSLAVQNYWWDFGDGSTSNLKNPQHTYSEVGEYDLKLITQAIEGCKDTLIIEKAIVVGKVKANFVSESEENACAPHLTNFKNTSNGAVNFQWYFGDGTESAFENPVKVYHNAGIFDVTLIADNGHSCFDTITSKRRFNVNTPEINFSLSDTSVCGPSEIRFQDLSKRVKSRKWFLGDGTVDTRSNLTHFYSRIGTSTITLLVTDTAGCVETLSKKLTVKEKPISKFSLDTLEGCSPATILFSNQSRNLFNSKHFWKINQNSVPTTSLDTNFVFTKGGSYDIGLISINSNKCADTLINKDYLKIFESKTVQASRVWLVSRTANNNWLIQWEENRDFEFKMYRLYRKTTDGDFEEIYRTENRSSNRLELPFNPNFASEQCFKIETIYHCVDPDSLDLLDPYCSVDLSAKSDSTGIHLSWNAYQTATFEAYEIWREPLKGGKKQLVSRVDKSHTQATDPSTLCPEKYIYWLKVINIYDKGFQAFSDTVIVQPQNTITSIDLTIKRATVLDDNQVLLEWEAANYSPEVVNGYRLEKSKTRGGFQIIQQFPLGVSSFIDEYAAPNLQSVAYKLSLNHTCNHNLKIERDASSIWLSIERDGSINHLKWTPAIGLKDGVQFYHIQLKNKNGIWETVKTVEADQLETYIDSYQLEK